ncbi:hypothetical protein PPERSA_11806 [Pseudocohnilembus persalinus]|uniref:Uncharacterized protein n=1 Tax=Pseudocohnilembus persalinus TaxID=266149 RepID=A0A0V0QR14_PSEPJ|nr:hypothetical protein PPERSA_11806 [Pseudocohnilembus persalinus]|eukprot:KRX04750.1 hypothetical protein PPERSA_11806 [Pseudocohnilembus persalinus]
MKESLCAQPEHQNQKIEFICLNSKCFTLSFTEKKLQYQLEAIEYEINQKRNQSNQFQFGTSTQEVDIQNKLNQKKKDLQNQIIELKDKKEKQYERVCCAKCIIDFHEDHQDQIFYIPDYLNDKSLGDSFVDKQIDEKVKILLKNSLQPQLDQDLQKEKDDFQEVNKVQDLAIQQVLEVKKHLIETMKNERLKKQDELQEIKSVTDSKKILVQQFTEDIKGFFLRKDLNRKEFNNKLQEFIKKRKQVNKEMKQVNKKSKRINTVDFNKIEKIKRKIQEKFSMLPQYYSGPNFNWVQIDSQCLDYSNFYSDVIKINAEHTKQKVINEKPFMVLKYPQLEFKFTLSDIKINQEIIKQYNIYDKKPRQAVARQAGQGNFGFNQQAWGGFGNQGQEYDYNFNYKVTNDKSFITLKLMSNKDLLHKHNEVQWKLLDVQQLASHQQSILKAGKTGKSIQFKAKCNFYNNEYFLTDVLNDNNNQRYDNVASRQLQRFKFDQKPGNFGKQIVLKNEQNLDFGYYFMFEAEGISFNLQPTTKLIEFKEADNILAKQKNAQNYLQFFKQVQPQPVFAQQQFQFQPNNTNQNAFNRWGSTHNQYVQIKIFDKDYQIKYESQDQIKTLIKKALLQIPYKLAKLFKNPALLEYIEWSLVFKRLEEDLNFQNFKSTQGLRDIKLYLVNTE